MKGAVKYLENKYTFNKTQINEQIIMNLEE